MVEERDPLTSAYWYTLASIQGDHEANEKLREVTSRLTEDQKERLKKLLVKSGN